MEETAIASFPLVLRRGGPPEPGNTARYAVIGFLGVGAFGSALLVERVQPALDSPHPVPPSEPQRYVAKIVDMSQMNEKNQAYAKLEIRTLSVCHHYGIVQYIEDHASPDGTKLLLIMEFADAGDLSRQIAARERAQQRFQESEAAFLFVQILLALDYLHRNRILHRDLKAANVFLTVRGTVKLGDFGFSQQYQDTVSEPVAGTFCGTPYYISPEVWKSKKYSKKADIWSLGVVTHQTCALAAPFKASTMSQLMSAVLVGVRPSLAPLGFPNLEPVVAWMLSVDPFRRPTTRQVLHHPYVKLVTLQLLQAIQSSKSFTPEIQAAITADVAFVHANPPRDASLFPSSQISSTLEAAAAYIAHQQMLAEQAQRQAQRPNESDSAGPGSSSDADGASPPSSLQEEPTAGSTASPAPTTERPPHVRGHHIRLDVAHEGPVNHFSNGAWKKRYFKLEHGTIVVCVVRDGAVVGSRRVSLDHVRGVVPMAPQHAEGADNAFAIEIVGGRSLLQAPSAEERDTWLAKLQLATGEEGE